MEYHWEGDEVDFSWVGLARRPVDVNTGEAPKSMISLEMLQFSDNLQTCDEQTIDGEPALLSWLKKDLDKEKPTLSPNAQRPSSGQRMLFGALHYDRKSHRSVLPFNESTYTCIKEYLGLPDDFRYLIAEKGSRSLKYTTEFKGNTLQCYFYKFTLYRPAYYILFLSYNRSTNLTHGLLLALSRFNSPTHNIPNPKLISSLKSQGAYCKYSQPLLLANLVAEAVVETCERQINAQDSELNRLEEVMGQHKYTNRPIGDPLAMDFKSATQTLNFISRTLSLEILRLGGTRLTLERIMEDTREIVNESMTNSAPDENLRQGLKRMQDLESHLMNYCRNQELRAAYEEKRVQTQSAAIYSFVAQKDAKVNIELAESMALLAVEARADNKVMKTIAVLGMVFLPGTFVAAIFAMPLIDWSRSAPVANNGFKYYWAVTVPLTAVVLLLWAVLTRKEDIKRGFKCCVRAKNAERDVEKVD